ncbi:MAG: hypothetical protein UU87_C0005G0001, partial [Parcubacteria group bacterium GW2011_GWA2_42_11]
NSIIETGEECDGTNLADQTCASKDLIGGTLACSASCKFDTRGCIRQLPPGYNPGESLIDFSKIETPAQIAIVIIVLLIIAAAGYIHYHRKPQGKQFKYNYKS